MDRTCAFSVADSPLMPPSRFRDLRVAQSHVVSSISRRSDVTGYPSPARSMTSAL
ncbi:hypothetical protein L842_5856 [Mycobacterium intracellulare MIN_052511_1280]|nr:hypothetical protein L842_5856 [Mycobacterium intracellulare MIN_052511_1280]